jgi:DNA-binding LacI/PurR family transcriptional regulator
MTSQTIVLLIATNVKASNPTFCSLFMAASKIARKHGFTVLLTLLVVGD